MAVGSVSLDECAGCGGVWVDPPAFERICAEREQQAVVLRAPQGGPSSPPARQGPDRYWPCPVCGRFMNRQNFARISGVIVDVCRGHGVWFNQGELRRIVEFVREGGLSRAREREKADLEEERRRLQRAEQRASPGHELAGFMPVQGDRLDYGEILAAARHLLKGLFD